MTSGQSPTDFDTAIRSARRARSEGRRRDALSAYCKALDLRPGDVNVRLDVVTELRTLGRFDEAIACLEPLRRGSIRHARAQRHLAQIFKERGDHRAAAETLEQMATFGDPDASLRIGAARAFMEIGDEAAFQRNLSAVFAQAPGHPQATLLKARRLESSGDPFAAFDVLDAHGREVEARGGPAHFDTVSYLVGLALRLGRLSTAEELLSILPLSGPMQEARAAFLRSHCLRYRNRLPAAEAELVRAVRLAPCAVPLRLGLAEVRLVLGRTQAADEDMKLGAKLLAAIPQASQAVGEYAYLVGFQRLVGDDPEASKQLLDRLTGDFDEVALLDGLMDLAARFPDHVPISLAVLRSLHLSGRLGQYHPGPSPTIPRTLFQYWDTPVPPADVEALMASWPKTSPGFDYLRVDDASARAFLAAFAGDAALAAFDKAAHPAMRSDLFRLAFAFHRGGVYADADEAALVGLEEITPRDADLLLIIEEMTGVLWNGFFAAAPGHPVIGRALNLAVDRVLAGEEGTVWSITGPPILALAATQILVERPDVAAGLRLISKARSKPWLATGLDCAYKKAEGNWKNAAQDAALYRSPPA